MNSLTPVVDLTTARKNLSKIIDQVFLNNSSVVIAKRNIPLAKLVKVSGGKVRVRKARKVDNSLFGIWKDRGKSTLELAKEFREKAWRGNI